MSSELNVLLRPGVKLPALKVREDYAIGRQGGWLEVSARYPDLKFSQFCRIHMRGFALMWRHYCDFKMRNPETKDDALKAHLNVALLYRDEARCARCEEMNEVAG